MAMNIDCINNSEFAKEFGQVQMVYDKFKHVKTKTVFNIENKKDLFDCLEMLRFSMVKELPNEVIEVRKLFRRSIGSRTGGGDGGSLFEPFNMAYTNTYLLSGSKMGGLATYDLFSQHQELVGRMFGSFIEFKWNTTTKKLTLLQRPAASEEILLYAYNYRPDEQLLSDYLASQWIKDYTLASCKYMLGEARSKFATIAGPAGGSTLNGDALKAEAQAEIEKLEADVALAVGGGVGYGFTIG